MCSKLFVFDLGKLIRLAPFRGCFINVCAFTDYTLWPFHVELDVSPPFKKE